MTVFRSQVRSIPDLRGPAGPLEALLNTGQPDVPFCALVCHPHPLFGGTMHNKVVYHATKVLTGFGLPALRFNFRGVGLSQGQFDHGLGEQDDVRSALDWLDREFHLPILFAGFSFGSHVGLRACCGDPRVAGLIALGLPVEAEGRTYTYDFLPDCLAPKLFITGDQDPFAPQAIQQTILAAAPEPTRARWIRDADHFFQGTASSPEPKLAEMQHEIRSWLSDQFNLSEQAP